MNPTTRCTAHRKNGTECKNAAVRGTNICRMHGGSAPQVRRRAAQRLLEASDSAAHYLVSVIRDETKPDAIRLAAARDLLDRAGLGGKERVEVEVVEPEPKPWEKLVASGDFIRVVHLEAGVPTALPTADDDARPAPRELEMVAAPATRTAPRTTPRRVPVASPVPPSDSHAAEAMYRASRDAADPMPTSAVQRVDGGRPRMTDRQRRRRS